MNQKTQKQREGNVRRTVQRPKKSESYRDLQPTINSQELGLPCARLKSETN